jgi:chromosome segregation ATPase
VGVTAELQAATQEFEDMKAKYLEIRDQIKKSEKNLNDRLLKWQTQLKYLEKSVAKNFDAYMQKKAYAGTVKFNHAEKLLHLETQTDNFDENTQCSDVRQLSGGERSYTTLSLLLALGLVVSTLIIVTLE